MVFKLMAVCEPMGAGDVHAALLGAASVTTGRPDSAVVHLAARQYRDSHIYHRPPFFKMAQRSQRPKPKHVSNQILQ